ncbi:MAG TPA: branched-chain amino acid ABC transporter permease [Usitatibacter sp.]|nr:branched-chain amino acid ABC transporter permease [Usitatibacter sp.]
MKYVALAVISIAAPWLFPSILTQLAFLWLMILFALTWDILGGQMGYNSFGNVVFFGLGMYMCAVIQRDSGLAYFPGVFVGMAAGAVFATVVSAVLGPAMLGLRGHYFAIGTLGLAVAAGDLSAAIEYIGAGSGMTPPLFPGEVVESQRFYYYVLFAIAVAAFALLRSLYARRFGLVLNAIRDDEGKAEAMGLHTTRSKVVAWCVAAFFLGLAGGPVGNLAGFIDPNELAFAGSTFGVWMVLMAILGGRGSLWGPVVGAVIFHTTQELFWTYLLGWQRVAMGLLIVAIVLFFPQGIVGWIRARRR